MNISNNISGINPIVTDTSIDNTKTTISESRGESFDSFYTASMNMFNETNDMQIQANQAQMDYLTGKTDNMLGVIMSQERALSSLNFTVQVTNKMVEVYKQIMQIQI